MITTPNVSNSQAFEKDYLELSYLDGRPSVVGVEAVNTILKSVGVRVSQIDIPDEASPILDAYQNRPLTEAERTEILQMFFLDRRQLLEQISLAGRVPEAPRGGLLSTSEIGVDPYPKVYDFQALTQDVRNYLLGKFGKLHVNLSVDGVGIDEVMTVIKADPLVWFFRLADGQVGRLNVGAVKNGYKAWRISYPGMGIHGGFLDSEKALIVAFAHGPKHFEMSYEESSVEGAELLGDNPWIDFTGEVAKIR